MAEAGREKKTAKSGKQTEITQAAAHKRVIEITDTITVSDLAHRMAVKSSQVIGSLMGMGAVVAVNRNYRLRNRCYRGGEI